MERVRICPERSAYCLLFDCTRAMHDSTIAEWGGVYSKLQEAFDLIGGRCVVESAFCKSNYPYLIKSAQDCLAASDGTIEDMNYLQQAKSVRQALE